MTHKDAQEVMAFIVSSLRQPLSANGFDANSIPDDLDLRAQGVIDSLGFMRLIASIEARFDCTIDFAHIDPEQLTNLSVLSRHIATQVTGQSLAG